MTNEITSIPIFTPFLSPSQLDSMFGHVLVFGFASCSLSAVFSAYTATSILFCQRREAAAVWFAVCSMQLTVLFVARWERGQGLLTASNETT